MGRVDHRHGGTDSVGIDLVFQAVQEVDEIVEFQRLFFLAHDGVSAFDEDHCLDRQFEMLDIADDEKGDPRSLVFDNTVGGKCRGDGDSLDLCRGDA